MTTTTITPTSVDAAICSSCGRGLNLSSTTITLKSDNSFSYVSNGQQVIIQFYHKIIYLVDFISTNELYLVFRSVESVHQTEFYVFKLNYQELMIRESIRQMAVEFGVDLITHTVNSYMTMTGVDDD